MSSDNPKPSPSSTDEAKFQPPFAPTGTSPQADTAAEGLINAAAKHAFPAHPAPPRDDDAQEAKEASAPGIKDEPVGEEEEQPIATGTPLDEIKTPVLERGVSGKLSTLTESPVREKQSSAARSEATQPEAESSAPSRLAAGEGTEPRVRPKRRDTADTLTPKPSVPQLRKPPAGSSGSTQGSGSSRPRSFTVDVQISTTRRGQERTRSRTTDLARPPMLDRDIGSVSGKLYSIPDNPCHPPLSTAVFGGITRRFLAMSITGRLPVDCLV